jgi:hypothetical protein
MHPASPRSSQREQALAILEESKEGLLVGYESAALWDAAQSQISGGA